MNEVGYIYVLKFGPFWKIGKSIHPVKRALEIQDRLEKLQPHLPFTPLFPFLFMCWLKDLSAVESAIHRHFADKRKRGEWFELSEADIQWMIEQEEIPFWCVSGEEYLSAIPCPS